MCELTASHAGRLLSSGSPKGLVWTLGLDFFRVFASQEDSSDEFFDIFDFTPLVGCDK